MSWITHQGKACKEKDTHNKGWGMCVYMFQKTQDLGRNPRELRMKMMNIKMKLGVEWETNGRQIEFPMGVE
jgi:hypothetical protein